MKPCFQGNEEPWSHLTMMSKWNPIAHSSERREPPMGQGAWSITVFQIGLQCKNSSGGTIKHVNMAATEVDLLIHDARNNT